MHGIVWWVLYVVVSIAGLIAPFVCAMKGRWGWLLFGLFPVPVLPWFVGAGLLARPSSFWARRWYDDAKMARAKRPFRGRGALR
jgi:hypothetical protein